MVLVNHHILETQQLGQEAPNQLYLTQQRSTVLNRSLFTTNKQVYTKGRRKTSVFLLLFFKTNPHTIMYATASLEWKGQTITITRRDDDSIQIHPTIFPSVKAGLREIADAQGISYDPSWNTRYLGMRVLKALNGVKNIDCIILKNVYR